MSGDRSISLKLLLLPGVFDPDNEWSTAFLDGLLRKPWQDYTGRRLVEIGTGSGWISLALLRLTELDSVLGLDLNPHAVLASRLNTVLNGFDAEGDPLPGDLPDRYTSQVSDLLAEPIRTGYRADVVVGCLPQVIPPARKPVDGNGYDLNNYAPAQGVPEDAFGLGLNARLLREARQVLDPGGSVILNLACRPHNAVLRRMIRRHGFAPAVLWCTRVQQTADTDISDLARWEQGTGRTYFYLHRHATVSVPARVALDRQTAGLPVYHDLQVVECTPRSPALVPLVQALAGGAVAERADALDTTDSDAVFDQRLRFAVTLTGHLTTEATAPYPHERGDMSLRAQVLEVLHRHHDLALIPDDVFVAPNRTELIHAVLLSLVSPGETVLIADRLRDTTHPAVTRTGADAVWLDDNADQLAELLPRLRPRLVLLNRVDGDVAGLLRLCERHNALVVLDESADLALDDLAPDTPGLRMLASHPDTGHLAVVLGLTAGPAFPDVALAALLTRHRDLTHAVATVAELTWSRISWFDQMCVQSRFVPGAAIRFDHHGTTPLPARPVHHRLPTGRSGPAPALLLRTVLAAPAFARADPAPSVIRLDYGENELPLPPRLRAAIVHGYLVRGDHSAAGAAVRAAADYLRATRMPDLRDEEVVLGAGSLPLLSDALVALRGLLGRRPVVALPVAGYGLFAPLAQAAGATVLRIAAAPPDFLLTPAALADVGRFDVLLLTNPGNPSGAAYRSELLRELVALVADRGARLVLDEVFGLLRDLDAPLPLGEDRWAGWNADQRDHTLLLGGLSKEFAAGGLRAGFAATTDSRWLRALRAGQLSRPSPSGLRTVARLFADLPLLWPEVDQLRQRLRAHRARLATGLRELGFGVTDAERGGLFLFPDLTPLTDDPDTFVLELERHAGVRLNTPAWSGVATHARACFAVRESRIDEAVDRMRAYLRHR